VKRIWATSGAAKAPFDSLASTNYFFGEERTKFVLEKANPSRGGDAKPWATSADLRGFADVVARLPKGWTGP
jgi:hypothetical protein